jgi:hypothetical protein
MAYIVNKTDGTAVTTITDGTIDNTTSLTLFGKSYSGFGELLNEDLVKLLENSASTSAPSAPLKGEVWFDTTVNQLKVYDGTSFKPTGGAKSQASAPTSPSAGDLWVDSTNSQLYFYTGSAFILAGPVYTSGQTLSGFKIETVRATTSVDYVVAFMYSGNIRVACVSQNAEFTPQSAITGFAKIYPGITLNSTLAAVFAGTTTSTTHVNVDESTDNTSGSIIAGKNFLRADAADTTTGAITIASDNGLLVGAGSDLRLTVSGIDATIANVSEDGNLSIQIKDGLVTKTPIAITGSTGNIALTGDVTITGNLTISGSYDKSSVDVSTYVDAFIGVNEGANANADGGIIVEQNGGVEARLFYDESANIWVAGKSNTTYSQIIRLDDLTADGDANKNTKALKTTAAGNLKVTSLTLGSTGGNLVSSNVKLTESADYASADVPTKAEVIKSVARWGGSVTTGGAGGANDDGSNSIAGNRYISTTAPDPGVNDAGTSDGDFWFVRAT